MKNSGENVFDPIPVGADEPALVARFLDAHDFAPGTRRGIVLDLRKLARWTYGYWTTSAHRWRPRTLSKYHPR